MIGNLVVALIVALAALHAGRNYLPASWRRRLLHRLAPGPAGRARLTRWLDAEAGCGSGCARCQGCAAPDPGAPAPTVSNGRPVIRLQLRK